jgi:hypothetical protein
VEGMMRGRATVAKSGDVESSPAEVVMSWAEHSETEPLPPSGDVVCGWGARSTARGRLEVAAAPDVVLDGVSVDFSRLQSRIFAALLQSDGPLSTAQLSQIVWQGRFVSEHTVHSQIALLRIRLHDFGLRIRNVRGRGYVLE